MHIRYAIKGAPPGIAAKASGVPIAMAAVEPLTTVATKNNNAKIRYVGKGRAAIASGSSKRTPV